MLAGIYGCRESAEEVVMKTVRAFCRVILATWTMCFGLMAHADQADRAGTDVSDVSSEAPGGFADVMNQTRGVMVRVPIDAYGRENTDKAELRFLQQDVIVTKGSRPDRLWRMSRDPGRSPEVLGTNIPDDVQSDRDRDSSTWGAYGWYGWNGLGWAYPYYYTYYYPTFYYYNNWWYYSYYWNWTWYGYRYYYYNWWY